jgi:hypothetical protein
MLYPTTTLALVVVNLEGVGLAPGSETCAYEYAGKCDFPRILIFYLFFSYMAFSLNPKTIQPMRDCIR